MSETNDEALAATSERDERHRNGLVTEDWFLQSLVNMCNNYEMEIGITLNVDGFLISGTLSSGTKYFQSFGEEFTSGFSDHDLAKDISENFASYGDIYLEPEGKESLPPPAFIHLRDAKFFNTSGNPIPYNRGVWWRGKISSVSGFSYGVLKAGES